MKRKEDQLDLFGSEATSKSKDSPRKAPVARQPRRTERIAGPTTELFDDFELLPTSVGAVSRPR